MAFSKLDSFLKLTFCKFQRQFGGERQGVKEKRTISRKIGQRELITVINTERILAEQAAQGECQNTSISKIRMPSGRIFHFHLIYPPSPRRLQSYE